MPELPDIAAYIHALEPRIPGQPLQQVRLASFFLLRTVDPPLASAAVPVLVIVTVCDPLCSPSIVDANVRPVADNVTGGLTPVPLSAIACGELPASSVMRMAASNTPATVGAKCPCMLQLAPAAKLAPQLFANTNEDAFGPVTAMLAIDNAAVPVFVNVTDCELLEPPTVSLPNDKLVADKDTTAGDTPFPLNAIVSTAFCTSRLLSVTASPPEIAPPVDGSKPMVSGHEAPAVNA